MGLFRKVLVHCWQNEGSMIVIMIVMLIMTMKYVAGCGSKPKAPVLE